MPPLQPSLRNSLLTGASALALSASGAQAQGSLPGAKDALPAWTFWVEGATFWTAGGHYNVPASPPGSGAPFLSFNPKNGFEGALGFDYRWPNQAWHFVFDIRYGRTRTAGAKGSFSRTNLTFPFGPGSPPFTSTISGNSHGTEREGHLVADFMIGRDLGLGSGAAQIQFGLRVADLWASAHVDEAGSRTFYSISGGTTIAQAMTGDWRSNMFGAGPRVALTRAIPIVGWWTFDYSGGLAGLLGTRSFNASVTNTAGFPGVFTNFSSTAFIFNADGSAALSYWFTQNYKVSAGIRGDFYNAALTTFNVNTGGYEHVNRLFWGPFIRLTGAF